MENTSGNALRCHGESVPNINNITNFDGRELASMVVKISISYMYILLIKNRSRVTVLKAY